MWHATPCRTTRPSHVTPHTTPHHTTPRATPHLTITRHSMTPRYTTPCHGMPRQEKPRHAKRATAHHTTPSPVTSRHALHRPLHLPPPCLLHGKPVPPPVQAADEARGSNLIIAASGDLMRCRPHQIAPSRSLRRLSRLPHRTSMPYRHRF